jgi:protein subunit release factor B
MGDSHISPEKIHALEERMKDLGIQEKDIEEKFIRSQGKGGQKVNKSSSCILKAYPYRHRSEMPEGPESGHE